MIEKDTLEQLHERIDLVAVVSRHLDLKKSGATWVACCPFHDEKSPSFTLWPGDPAFHCFGCGAHGDAIDFLQRVRGISFTEAVDELAAEAGLVVKQGQAPPLRAKHKFRPAPAAREGHQVADENDLERLAAWQRALPGSPAEEYLRRRRIPLEVAQAVGAGFLPDGEAMGINADGKPTGYGPRVVVPHTLPGGEVVNLYGRSIDPDADKSIKHRHLPLPKGMLNTAALDLPGPLWIVEGAFDCLSLMAAGVQKVVAIFGLAGFDWRWIGRQDLVIATDADQSGEKAAQQLLVEAAYRGLKAHRFQIPAGHKDLADAWVAGDLVLPVDRAPAEDPLVLQIRRHVEQLDGAPDAHLAAGWHDFKATASRFATLHLAEALAAGWTVEDLFSLPSNRAGADGGAIWTLAGFRAEAFEIDAESISAVMQAGHRLPYRRGVVTGRLPWVV